MNHASRTQPLKTQKGHDQRRGSFARAAAILLLIFFCLILAGIGVGGVQIPRMAENDFGPSNSSLSAFQRVVYSIRLLANRATILTPLDPQGETRQFTINLGESVDSISNRLEDERFISNADAFRTYLVYSGLDKGVQAGNYELSSSMTILQIAHVLQDSAPKEVEFNILPGWRSEEIAAGLPSSGIQASPDEFLNLVQNPTAAVLPDALPDELASLSSLEGFLMPGEYKIDRQTKAQVLVKMFYDRFHLDLSPDIRQGFTDQGLTLTEGVTLASIVQREAVVEDEQPMIASVFYNRIASKMKLDSDPTVQYAVGYVEVQHTWWKNPLTAQDLQINSRYNTYIYPGLPPGPIDNPGLPALRAVAFPAQTEFYYFRAMCDGSGRHAFAKTYEEHLQNACP